MVDVPLSPNVRIAACLALIVALIAGGGPVRADGDGFHAHPSNPDSPASTGASPSAAHDHRHEPDPGTAPVGPEEARPLEALLPGLAGAPNVHPMVVHFPIVFLLTSLLFVGLSWFRRSDFFLRAAQWLFWLGLVALLAAVLTGFLAVGGWGDGHVTVHRNLMLITALLAFGLFGLLRWMADRRRLYRIVLTAGLILVTLVMTLGADRGAWLVFVEGAGVQPVEHQHDHP